MGAWGITALESDTGFDAVEFIRGMIPENGELVLGKILNEMRHNELARTEDASNGISHTGMMAVAEIMAAFLFTAVLHPAPTLRRRCQKASATLRCRRVRYPKARVTDHAHFK